MDMVLYIIGGLVFLIAMAAYFYVKLALRPKAGSDFDEYYYEFEEQHPGFARYTKWSKITFTAAVVGALLMFIGAVI